MKKFVTVAMLLLVVLATLAAETKKPSPAEKMAVSFKPDGVTIQLDDVTGKHFVRMDTLTREQAPESGYLPFGQPNDKSVLVTIIPLAKTKPAQGYLQIGLFDPKQITLEQVFRQGKVSTPGRFKDQFGIIWYQRSGSPLKVGEMVNIKGSLVWQRTTKRTAKFTLKQAESTFSTLPSE